MGLHVEGELRKLAVGVNDLFQAFFRATGGNGQATCALVFHVSIGPTAMRCAVCPQGLVDPVMVQLKAAVPAIGTAALAGASEDRRALDEERLGAGQPPLVGHGSGLGRHPRPDLFVKGVRYLA